MHYKVITFTIFGEQTITEVEAKSMSEVAKKYRYCIVDKDGKYGRYYKGKKVATKPKEFKIWREGKQAWLLTITVSTGHKIQEVHFDNRYMKEQKEDSTSAKSAKPLKLQSPTTVSIEGTKDIVAGWTMKKISNESVTNAINEVTEILGSIDKSSGKDNANALDVKEWYDGINPYLSEPKSVTRTYINCKPYIPKKKITFYEDFKAQAEE